MLPKRNDRQCYKFPEHSRESVFVFVDRVITRVMAVDFDPVAQSLTDVILDMDKQDKYPEVSENLILHLLRRMGYQRKVAEIVNAKNELAQNQNQEVRRELTPDDETAIQKKLKSDEAILRSGYLYRTTEKKLSLSLDNQWSELLPATLTEEQKQQIKSNTLKVVSDLLVKDSKVSSHAYIARVVPDEKGYDVWYSLGKSCVKTVVSLSQLTDEPHRLIETDDENIPNIDAALKCQIQVDAQDIKIAAAEKHVNANMLGALAEARKQAFERQAEVLKHVHKLDVMQLMLLDHDFKKDPMLKLRLEEQKFSLDLLGQYKTKIIDAIANDRETLHTKICALTDDILRADLEVKINDTDGSDFLTTALTEAIYAQIAKEKLPSESLKLICAQFSLVDETDADLAASAISRLHDRDTLMAGINKLIILSGSKANLAIKDFIQEFENQLKKALDKGPLFVIEKPLIGKNFISFDPAIMRSILNVMMKRQFNADKAHLVEELFAPLSSDKLLSKYVNDLDIADKKIKAESENLEQLRTAYKALNKKHKIHGYNVQLDDKSEHYVQGHYDYIQSCAAEILKQNKEFTADDRIHRSSSSGVIQLQTEVANLKLAYEQEMKSLNQLEFDLWDYQTPEELEAAQTIIINKLDVLYTKFIAKVSEILHHRTPAEIALQEAITQQNQIYDLVKHIVTNWDKKSTRLEPVKQYLASAAAKALEVKEQKTVLLHEITKVFHMPKSIRPKSEFHDNKTLTQKFGIWASNAKDLVASRFTRSQRSIDFYIILNTIKELGKNPAKAEGLYDKTQTEKIIQDLETFMSNHGFCSLPKKVVASSSPVLFGIKGKPLENLEEDDVLNPPSPGSRNSQSDKK